MFAALFAVLGWVFDPSGDETQTLFGWLSVAIIVLFAFEANDLRGAALEQQGYTQVGTAIGAGRDDTELAFLKSWLPRQEKGQERQPRQAAGQCRYPGKGKRRGGGDRALPDPVSHTSPHRLRLGNLLRRQGVRAGRARQGSELAVKITAARRTWPTPTASCFRRQRLCRLQAGARGGQA